MYQIFVNIIEDNKWKEVAVRPTNGMPYKFKTRSEAEKIKRICYGDDNGVKIRKV